MKFIYFNQVSPFEVGDTVYTTDGKKVIKDIALTCFASGITVFTYEFEGENGFRVLEYRLNDGGEHIFEVK
jgi:hypothetical protein